MDYPEEENLPSTSGASNISTRKTPISCFVPGCPSNSIKFPSKIFLTVPREPNIRKLWMQAVKRNDISLKSIVRCCEDHFDMENDIENWVKYKLVGCPLCVKKGVVPHIFNCEQTVKLKRKRPNVPQSIENEQEMSSKFPISKDNIDEIQENYKDKCIQASIYSHKRSKQVQAAIKIPTKTVTVSPKKVVMKDCKTSPLKFNTYSLIYSDSDNDSKKSYSMETGDTGTTSSSIASDYLDQEKKKKNMSLQLTIDYIMADPKLYLGVPKDSLALINLIQETIQVPHHHIYLLHRRSEEPAVTSVTCYWKKPRMALTSSSVVIKAKDMGKSQSVGSSYDDVNLLTKFLDTVSKTDCNASIQRYFVNNQQPLSIHKICTSIKLSTAENFLEILASEMTDKNIQAVFNATKEQSEAPLWYELRYGRITGSILHEAAQCQTTEGSLMHKVMGQQYAFTSEAIVRGKYLEKKVMETVKLKENIRVSESGLILSRDFPVLGATPDGISDDYVIEIKCPATEKSFKTYYVKDGELTKKCWCQIQSQMYMAKKKMGLFCVAHPDFENSNNVDVL